MADADHSDAQQIHTRGGMEKIRDMREAASEPQRRCKRKPIGNPPTDDAKRRGKKVTHIRRWWIFLRRTVRLAERFSCPAAAPGMMFAPSAQVRIVWSGSISRRL